MNKSILVLLLSATIALLSFYGCRNSSDEHNVSVRVKVKESSRDLLFLERITLDGNVLIDSARTDSQGEVTFSLHTSDFDYLLLTDRTQPGILLLVAEDETVEVFTRKQQLNSWYEVKGSGGSALLRKLALQKRGVDHQLDSLGKLWLTDRYADDNQAKKFYFDSISNAILTEHKAGMVTFIERYITSPATIIAVYQMARDGKPLFTLEDRYVLFVKMANALAKEYPENQHVKDFSKRVADYRIEQDAYIARETMLKSGSPAPPLKLFDTSGEVVDLTTFAGKYVLLCFWDARKSESWDVNRKLSLLYNQYRSKGFEILGIYTGEDKQLLFNAMKIDPMPWIHLFSNSATVKNYNVRKVPQLMLVGRDGNILYRTIHIDDLPSRLSRLFSQPVSEPDTLGVQNDQ